MTNPNQKPTDNRYSLLASFTLERVGKELWPQFATFHYRSEKLFFPDRIFAMKHSSGRYAGIIVYSYPQANSAARNKVLANYYQHFPANVKLKIINYELRTITRLVVLPEFRGVSLASELIRRTIPLTNMRFIEAATVMGNYSNCFARAGMKYYQHEQTAEKQTMQKQLENFGLDYSQEIEAIAQQFQSLCQTQKQSLLKSMHSFCCHYQRSLRKQRPDIKQLNKYLAIIKFRINTRCGYYFHDLAGEIAN